MLASGGRTKRRAWLGVLIVELEREVKILANGEVSRGRRVGPFEMCALAIGNQLRDNGLPGSGTIRSLNE